MKRVWPPLTFLVAILFGLEILVNNGTIPSFLVPSPTQMWATFLAELPSFVQATQETLIASANGLAFSLVIGVSLAFLFSIHELIRRALYPYMIFFQTVPVVAIAPLLVIWFGFGMATVRASATIVAVFPVLASSMAGLELASRENRELFKALGSRPWQTLVKLSIPSALPSFFSGLRIAAGLSVVGAIVGEFIAGGGLGSLIDSARTQQRVDIVFVALLLSSFLGFLLVSLVDFSRILVLRYRPYFD